MRSPILGLSGASLLFVFTAMAACGGATARIDDAGAADQGDGSALDDSGSRNQRDGGGLLGDGEALGAACPAAPPQHGATCSTPDLTCEYGGVGPHLRCSTVFACVAPQGVAATWIARKPPPDCVGTQAENAPTCPASFGALPTGSACPSNTGSACVYPEGLCECSPCAAPDGGGSLNLWSCKDWPVPVPACPSPRARIGSACTMDMQSCFYGSVCSSVGFDQPAMVCRKGLWHDEPVPVPPCPFPTCGQ